MLNRNEIETLALVRHSLDRMGTYLAATDRADNARHGVPLDVRSPITRDLEQARALLDSLLTTTIADHPDERPREGACVTYRVPGWDGTLADGTIRSTPEPRAAGDLLAHVLDTAGDPARVREHMTNADANDLLARSLTQTGTTEEDAHRVADLYVPVTPGRHWLRPVPTPKDLAERARNEDT